jgi:hypothetical protein
LEAARDALEIARTRASDAEREPADAKAQLAREKKAEELRAPLTKINAAWASAEPALVELIESLRLAPNPDAAQAAILAGELYEALKFQIPNAKSAIEHFAAAALQGGEQASFGQSASVVGLFRRIGVG